MSISHVNDNVSSTTCSHALSRQTQPTGALGSEVNFHTFIIIILYTYAKRRTIKYVFNFQQSLQLALVVGF